MATKTTSKSATRKPAHKAANSAVAPKPGVSQPKPAPKKPEPEKKPVRAHAPAPAKTEHAVSPKIAPKPAPPKPSASISLIDKTHQKERKEGEARPKTTVLPPISKILPKLEPTAPTRVEPPAPPKVEPVQPSAPSETGAAAAEADEAIPQNVIH